MVASSRIPEMGETAEPCTGLAEWQRSNHRLKDRKTCQHHVSVHGSLFSNFLLASNNHKQPVPLECCPQVVTVVGHHTPEDPTWTEMQETIFVPVQRLCSEPNYRSCECDSEHKIGHVPSSVWMIQSQASVKCNCN